MYSTTKREMSLPPPKDNKLVDGEEIGIDNTDKRGVVQGSGVWTVLGREFPRSEVVFFSQMIVILVVVLASVYNLTVGHDSATLWTALLSSCLGYILPNPSIPRRQSK